MSQSASDWVTQLMSVTARPSKFVIRVWAEMDAQKLSMRGLARRIDPSNIDRARRNLIRWLHEGIRPGRQSRRAVARALGIDPEELEEDDADADSLSLDELLERRIAAAVSRRFAALDAD
jgi:transcriptional regulator with XRE-family HTH domain